MRLKNVEELKGLVLRQLDILEVIQADLGDVEWKTSGDNHWTFSPFRDDGERPSFSVNPRIGIFKDFGGDAAGNLITWARTYWGMSYHEALTSLAKRAGIPLTEFTKDPTPQEAQEDRYLAIMAAVARSCHEALVGNKQLLEEYQRETGFTKEQLEEYQVGYSVGADHVTNVAFRSTGNVTHQEVDALELTRGALFDNALVYPIKDPSGNTRIFYTKPFSAPPDATYKYLGMRREHPLNYDGLLFGLSVARKNLRRDHGQLIVCEGFKQAISTTGVACMGAKISDAQIDTLREHKVKFPTILFDGDHAGHTASLSVATSAQMWGGMLVRIIRTPTGKQIDEIIRDEGIEALEALVEDAEIPLEYFLGSRYNLKGLELDVSQKYQILHDVREYVAALPPVEMEISVDFLADKLGVSRASMRGWAQELSVANTQLHNIEAERTILRLIILEPTLLSTAITMGMEEDALTLTAHRVMWKAVLSSINRFGTQSGPQTVADACAYFATEDYSTSVARIVELQTKYEFEPACEIVYDLWKRRRVQDQSKELQTTIQDTRISVEEIIAGYRKSLVSTTDRNTGEPSTPQEMAKGFAELLEERAKRDSIILGFDFSSTAMATCIVFGGLQKKHYFVIGGNTHTGKSMLAANIIHPIVFEQNIPWLWINLEMTWEALVGRFASIHTGISNTAINAGKLKSNQVGQVQEFVRKVHHSNIHIKRPVSNTADGIFHLIDEYKNKHGIQGVTLDYIQKLRASPNQTGMKPEEVYGNASKMLADRIAHDMDLAVVAISQQNRDRDARGKLEGVGGSYQIAQDADDFMIIEMPTKVDREGFGTNDAGVNRVLRIAKNRGGASALSFKARLEFDNPDSLRLTEYTDSRDWVTLMQRVA